MRIIKQLLFCFLIGITSLASASFVDVGPGISIGGKATLTSVRAVAKAGFKLVRLPSVEPPDIAVIDEALRLKMRVVVDFHPSLDCHFILTNVGGSVVQGDLPSTVSAVHEKLRENFLVQITDFAKTEWQYDNS